MEVAGGPDSGGSHSDFPLREECLEEELAEVRGVRHDLTYFLTWELCVCERGE